MHLSNNDVLINIGGLEGIASVYKNASSGLSQFNLLWKKGESPTIIWDLGNIRSGFINVAAASFFLAIAHRVRQFTGCKQPCNIFWNPNTFGFLSDIGFFEISDRYDLFDWPIEIGGFKSGKTNPNTKLLSYDPLMKIPLIKDFDKISDFKKIHREQYRKDIIRRCEALFTTDESRHGSNLVLTMSHTCAELATNSLLWGDSTAFLGLQRTRKKITISISDIGMGFRSSLLKKEQYVDIISEPKSDIISIAIGSIINRNGFGLNRAISTVVNLNGKISIASSSGEVFWSYPLWYDYLNCYVTKGVKAAISSLPEQTYKATYEDEEKGYVRNWSNPIRGSRILFTIPLV